MQLYATFATLEFGVLSVVALRVLVLFGMIGSGLVVVADCDFSRYVGTSLNKDDVGAVGDVVAVECEEVCSTVKPMLAAHCSISSLLA
jgi:hypothetical protein